MQTTLFTAFGNKLIYTEWTKKPILECVNDIIQNWLKEGKQHER